MQEQLSYHITEVAQWAETNYVSLPTVQRGFVWRPHQIENLWDSLLRAYPVGAFVLSPRGDNGYEILDGQQRATAICLGFAHKTFRGSHQQIRVFIDLDKPSSEDQRKYIFRVITKSHPWGYQKNEPNKTLSSDQIRKAMDLYDTDDPLSVDLDQFFPFDAAIPVPLHFFIDAVLENKDWTEVYRICTEWQHWEKVLQKWQQNQLGNTLEKVKTNIETLYKAVDRLLSKTSGQRIPALYLGLDQFMSEEAEGSSDAADEIENLFVRLNAGGTQLSGEELNYSILKAHLSRTAQDKIEEACKVLFRPARFITIAYRLFQFSNKGTQQSDGLSMRIKAKQFQKNVSKEATAFENFLMELVESKIYDEKILLDYAKSILEYKSETQPYGLPFLIYSKISDTAPELMFLFLYRIMIAGDRFRNVRKEDQTEHRKSLGILTLLMWFGKGENHKDHSKLLNNIWPIAVSSNQKTFWSKDLIDRASINNALIPFPFYQNSEGIGLEQIIPKTLNDKNSIFSKLETGGGKEYVAFFQNAIYNRDLLLYAQRRFLEQYYRQEQYRLEDTNVPFDWDHISPNAFVSGRRNIPQIVKDWYNTIGNFRAWPYALNRMDSDHCPAHKLKPLHAKNYDDVNHYASTKIKWQRFAEKNVHLIGDLSVLEQKLLEWSFCQSEWTKCESTNLRTDWKFVLQQIIIRNVSILKEWYQELLVDDLKSKDSFSFEQLLLKQYWRKCPTGTESIDEWFDPNDRENWISTSFVVDKWHLRFYFYYPHDGLNFLKANEMGFGIFNESGDDFLFTQVNKTNENYDVESNQWIERKFTLLSCSNSSLYSMLADIRKWLEKIITEKVYNEVISNKLNEFLVKKFIKTT